MIRTAPPSRAMRHEGTQRILPDRVNLSKSTQVQEVTSPEETHVALYRYVHLNDDQNTQIFTFLLLPHLLCGLLDEVESDPFSYAQHWWTVRFQRGDTHLGVFLELKCIDSMLSTQRLSQASARSPGHQVQCATISVDFQFTVKNREHFSRNESFSRTASVFHRDQPRHGRKKFVELTTLSSKRYLYDDGKCVIDLELKNPDVMYNLWAIMRPDPTMPSHYEQSMTHSNSVINLMRLDGSVISVGKSIHLETERFLYAESEWFLTLDLEPIQLTPMDSHGQPLRSAAQLHESDIVVNAELSLVRYTGKSTETKHRTSLSPGRSHTVNSRIKCSALLPGSCQTKVMDFNIGTQGWPTQAYRIQFRSSNKESGEHKITQDSTKTSAVADTAAKTTTGESAGTGSPMALLLSSVSSSPINIKLQIMSFSNVSFVEVPIINQSNSGTTPTCLIDPFHTPWCIRTSDSGRLLRLKFQSIPPMRRMENGDAVRHRLIPSTPFVPPHAICMLGFRIRINPLAPQLHAQVVPVGSDLVQLLHFTDGCKRTHSLSKADLADEWESLKYDAHINQSAISKVMSPESETSACVESHRRHHLTRFEPEEVCEVAMNVTNDEVRDKNAGLLNPLNGTIFVEIQWVYHQVICIDRFHSADLINARQYHQMRHELNQLRKERDELERQMMIKEMGLIQIDPSLQGPRSMLPLESIASVDTSEVEPNRLSSRSSSYVLSGTSGRDGYPPVEARLPRRHVSTSGSDSREFRRGSRPTYAIRMEMAGRTDTVRQNIGPSCSRYNPQHSFEYDSNSEDPLQTDTYSVEQSSVKSDYGNSRLPDRRKQFVRSKTAWQTYEGPRIHSPAEQFSPQMPHPSNSMYCTKPWAYRMKHLGTGDRGRSPVSSSSCSPRTYFQNHEENEFFHY